MLVESGSRWRLGDREKALLLSLFLHLLVLGGLLLSHTAGEDAPIVYTLGLSQEMGRKEGPPRALPPSQGQTPVKTASTPPRAGDGKRKGSLPEPRLWEGGKQGTPPKATPAPPRALANREGLRREQQGEGPSGKLLPMPREREAEPPQNPKRETVSPTTGRGTSPLSPAPEGLGRVEGRNPHLPPSLGGKTLSSRDGGRAENPVSKPEGPPQRKTFGAFRPSQGEDEPIPSGMGKGEEEAREVPRLQGGRPTPSPRPGREEASPAPKEGPLPSPSLEVGREARGAGVASQETFTPQGDPLPGLEGEGLTRKASGERETLGPPSTPPGRNLPLAGGLAHPPLPERPGGSKGGKGVDQENLHRPQVRASPGAGEGIPFLPRDRPTPGPAEVLAPSPPQRGVTSNREGLSPPPGQRATSGPEPVALPKGRGTGQDPLAPPSRGGGKEEAGRCALVVELQGLPYAQGPSPAILDPGGTQVWPEASRVRGVPVEVVEGSGIALFLPREEFREEAWNRVYRVRALATRPRFPQSPFPELVVVSQEDAQRVREVSSTCRLVFLR